MGEHTLFTSESVAIGHPDKVADQISDSILDACLREDPYSRVACETLVCPGMVFLAGEITTNASPNYRDIALNTIREIGYDDGSLGFDFRSCGVLCSINRQSSDIAMGVNEGEGLFPEQGAGDQGIMFGYACDETPELMPMPIALAHGIMRELRRVRMAKELHYLRPDAKTQVTIEYDENHTPCHIDTVVLSTQHGLDVDTTTIVEDMKALIQNISPKSLIDAKTKYYINPTGRFVIGGPIADSGLTGRKVIVDSYGGMARHGGGAFSGKDPTKVDRSGAYAMRYVAKHLVAAGLARRCEVQVSYAIGVAQPISIKVESFGTAVVPEHQLAEAIFQVFDLSPRGIIEMLDLRRPIYKKTAFGGHFGREEPEFTWEKLDKLDAVKLAVNQ